MAAIHQNSSHHLLDTGGKKRNMVYDNTIEGSSTEDVSELEIKNKLDQIKPSEFSNKGSTKLHTSQRQCDSTEEGRNGCTTDAQHETNPTNNSCSTERMDDFTSDDDESNADRAEFDGERHMLKEVNPTFSARVLDALSTREADLARQS